MKSYQNGSSPHGKPRDSIMAESVEMVQGRGEVGSVPYQTGFLAKGKLILDGVCLLRHQSPHHRSEAQALCC